MAGTWSEIVLIGAAVGLVYSIGPLLVEYGRMLQLLSYVNFDRIRFQQLLVTGGAEALALPLSKKLSEKGILLAWKTQRELATLRDRCELDGFPLEPGVYDSLAASLETYRDTVGTLSDRIGVLAWHAGEPFEGSVPPLVAAHFKAIDRDWAAFRRQSAFLQSFLKRHAGLKTRDFQGGDP